MTDMPDPQDVLEALGTTGFLMEQEVASMIGAHGFNVVTGWAYRDPDEDKSREIDIWAYKQVFRSEESKISISSYVVCECKNNSYSLAFLTRPKSEIDYVRPMRELMFGSVTLNLGGGRSRNVDRFHTLGLAEHHYYFKSPYKAVQFARIARDQGKWKASPASVLGSLFFPPVKAVKAAQDQRWKGDTGGWLHIDLFFPLAVVRGPIFSVDTSVDPPNTSAVDSVTFRRSLDSPNYSGIFTVDFIREDGVVAWLRESLFPFTKAVAATAERDPEIFRRATIGAGDFGYRTDLLS